MKTLIIGAAGFVGPYLVKAAKKTFDCDIVCTKLSDEKLDLAGTEVQNLNLLIPDDILSLLEEVRPDYIFNLAAQSSVAYSWKRPDLTVDINVKGTINLLNALRELSSSPKVLIVGSGEEYGSVNPEDLPIKETCLCRPGNIYAATKACQNMIATIYAKAYGLQLIMTRSFNHFGPGQAPTFVMSDFCHQVAEIEEGRQEPVIRVGNLSSKRDFTDVRDVTNAYCALLAQGKAGETYNVGSGKAHKIEDILHFIIGMSDKPIAIEIDPAKLRPADVPIIEADIGKIQKDTGWEPTIPLQKTICDMLTYWRKNAKAIETNYLF